MIGKQTDAARKLTSFFALFISSSFLMQQVSEKMSFLFWGDRIGFPML